MAEAGIEYLLENLKQLLVYESDLILGLKDLVESLYTELRILKVFLQDSIRERKENASVKELVRGIKDVVCEAEDVIDSFLAQVAARKARSRLEKFLHNFDYQASLGSVSKEIESIIAKVKTIYGDKMLSLEAVQLGESSNRSSLGRTAPIVDDDDVLGFDDEAYTLVDRLIEGPKQLKVISIVGMAGIGKTTLARKLFNGPSIQHHFSKRAWIYVSQLYNRRDLLLGILSCLTPLTDDIYIMSDERLAENLYRHLKGRRYLIVLDDVWTKESWNDLKMAFPNDYNGSRIMLTTRNNDVALHANPDSPPHYLRFLTPEESWVLLQKKVFAREICPLELEVLGRRIVESCQGLPLAILVIAGLLGKKEKTLSWWETVAENVSSYVAMDSSNCMDVLALSYNHLPYHLKSCFLYFGVFPEAFEIPVWKLILLWVAEGFIQRIGEVSMEDTAEENLEDLVDRNLVLVVKRSFNGRIKTCRIHHMFHDLCLREAAEENFFQELKILSSLTPVPTYHRRLCIHSHVSNYISFKPSNPRVRSFLCSDSVESNLPREQISFFFGAFKLLRVLDIGSFILPYFPIEIVQLFHLRYIAVSGNFKVLPSSISNLWNLQTLIVGTTSRYLDIQADIWKMTQFRHLYTSGGSSRFRRPHAKARKRNEDVLARTNIQTISNVSPGICTEDIIARTPNLKKLGIRGELVTLVHEKEGSSMFDNLAKLDHLETLKLLNDVFPDPPSIGKLPGLPQWYKFPPHLKKLTLSDTLLDWEHMSTLGMLPFLEVLKLKDHAFTGPLWEALDGGFRQLKALQLEKTDLVHWKASSDHFPSLERLVLKHCISLEEIPSDLGDVPTLKIVELYWPTSSVAASARSILEEQQSFGNDGLKLLIYPGDM